MKLKFSVSYGVRSQCENFISKCTYFATLNGSLTYHWRLGVVVKHHMEGLMYVPMHGICNHNGPLPLIPAFTAPARDATAGNA